MFFFCSIFSPSFFPSCTLSSPFIFFFLPIFLPSPSFSPSFSCFSSPYLPPLLLLLSAALLRLASRVSPCLPLCPVAQLWNKSHFVSAILDGSLDLLGGAGTGARSEGELAAKMRQMNFSSSGVSAERAKHCRRKRESTSAPLHITVMPYHTISYHAIYHTIPLPLLLLVRSTPLFSTRCASSRCRCFAPECP